MRERSRLPGPKGGQEREEQVGVRDNLVTSEQTSGPRDHRAPPGAGQDPTGPAEDSRQGSAEQQ